MLSCKEVSRLVSESLDRKLPLRQRLMVRVHLLMCRFCARFEKHMRFLRETICRHCEDVETELPSDSALSPQARQRIEQILKNKSS